jgi:hypothetical protein
VEGTDLAALAVTAAAARPVERVEMVAKGRTWSAPTGVLAAAPAVTAAQVRPRAAMAVAAVMQPATRTLLWPEQAAPAV